MVEFDPEAKITRAKRSNACDYTEESQRVNMSTSGKESYLLTASDTMIYNDKYDNNDDIFPLAIICWCWYS